MVRFLRQISEVFKPRGLDIHLDVLRYLPSLQIKTVLDVGANVGQSAARFVKWFSHAQIYSFEPGLEAFNRLHNAFGRQPHCHLFRMAMGKRSGNGKLIKEGGSDMYFMSKTSSATLPYEDVETQTVDEFCSQRTIQHVGYLKVDTEGGDLEVLQGADSMLSRHCVDLIELEAGMNSHNRRHVPFEEIKKFCEFRDYFLFGIYEQVPEWPSNEAHLRRVNCVFVSSSVIAANRI